MAGVLAGVLAVTLVGLAPALGGGFLRDDYRWLWHARLDDAGDLGRMLGEHLGFYRPVTSLSWAADLARDGPDPTAFGLTNLLLHFGVLAAFYLASRRLLRGLPREGAGGGTAVPPAPRAPHRPVGPLPRDELAAGLAVGLATLSQHTNRTAVLWISARGALLAALFGTLAILWWERWNRERRSSAAWLGACGLAGLACFSYDAAAALPLLMVGLLWLRPARPRRHASWGLGPLAVLGLYLLVRWRLGAMQPWATGAGYEYRLTQIPANLAEYLGRAAVPGLVLAAALLAGAALAGAAGPTLRRMGAGGRRILPVAAAWFVLGLAPALPVASRSDLYVYFAGLGIHLLAGAALAAGWLELREARPVAARRTVGVVAGILLVAWPPWAMDRTAEHRARAELAGRVVEALREAVPERRPDDCFVFDDGAAGGGRLQALFSGHLTWVVAHALGGPPAASARYSDGRPGEAAACSRTWFVRLESGGGEGSSPGVVVELRETPEGPRT